MEKTKQVKMYYHKTDGGAEYLTDKFVRCPNGSLVKMYYHKTDGGAEYLTDKFVRCPDGSRCGVFENAKYIIRLDGEAELTVVE